MTKFVTLNAVKVTVTYILSGHPTGGFGRNSLPKLANLSWGRSKNV